MPITSVSGRLFDTIIVGTGFGSSFYLAGALRRGAKRILVVEWGALHEHSWQLENNKNSAIAPDSTFRTSSDKPWNFTIGFGGGTNCWYGQTPRFHPSDFKLGSLYGVGADWPLTYDELEPYYVEAEEVMAISGDPDMAGIMPRSRPFPQPPHRMSGPDRRMKAAQPDHHFAMPTARARIATDTRSACCASLRCQLCPADAKFTILNGLMGAYQDAEVTLCTQAQAWRLETTGGEISELVLRDAKGEHRVRAGRFVLGANAIQSPAILLRSGLDHPSTGIGIHESYGASVEVFLDGLDNFDGSTITTGINYRLYDGEHRRDAAAALVSFDNRWFFGFRREPGRARETLPLIIAVEDLPQSQNRVTLAADGQAVVEFSDFSDYAKRGMARALEQLPDVLRPLPVEAIHFKYYRRSESHIQGTLRMGSDAARSVVDPRQIHHRWRNLTVVGSAVFPTCSCANPSLTVAALSLRAAALA